MKKFSHFQILLIYILVNHSNGSNVSRYGSNVAKYENSNVSKYDDNDGEESVDGETSTLIDTTVPNVTSPGDHSTPAPTSVSSNFMPSGDHSTPATTSVSSTVTTLSTEPTADDQKLKIAIYGGAGGACVVVVFVVLYFLYKRFRGPRKGGRFPEFETPLETLRSTGTIRDVESFPKLPPTPIPRPRPQPSPRQTPKRPSYENEENIYVDPDDLNLNHYVKS